MADWTSLRAVLVDVVIERTFDWQELDRMVDGLPRSAYVHNAFWKGSRSAWAEFTTTDVRVGHSVTFVRRSSTPPVATRALSETKVDTVSGAGADIALVGCVKKKRTGASPAKDLYVSALFSKEREYATATAARWFILSAEHGLARPDDVLEPYDRRLSDMPLADRKAWGTKVVDQLQAAVGSLSGLTIEVHAGSAYTDPIRAGLTARGAHVNEPLQGLTLGQRLAWYDRASTPSPIPTPPANGELVARLQDEASTQTMAEFLNIKDPAVRTPGLYSWWVDRDGAHDLTTGLGHDVRPGLIYSGLAGATQSRSKLRSSNTLWGRIHGMHLTSWMRQHLRLIAIPVADADTLDALETACLASLDPPLNLAKRPKTDLRVRLSELHRQYGGT